MSSFPCSSLIPGQKDQMWSDSQAIWGDSSSLSWNSKHISKTHFQVSQTHLKPHSLKMTSFLLFFPPALTPCTSDWDLWIFESEITFFFKVILQLMRKKGVTLTLEKVNSIYSNIFYLFIYLVFSIVSLNTHFMMVLQMSIQYPFLKITFIFLTI